MAVAYNTATSAGVSGTTSVSFSHTASGTDRLAMPACGAWPGTNAPSSVTYGGNSCTLVGSRNFATNNERASLYSFVAPSTSAQTVEFTFTESVSEGYCGCISLTGVNQTTPTSGVQDNAASGSISSISVTVSSATDDLVVDILSHFTAGSAPTVGANQTSRWSGNTNGGYGMCSTEPGGTSITMSWDNLTTAWPSALVAVNVKSASSIPVYAFQGNAFEFGQYIPGAASGISGTLSTSIGNFTSSATGRVEIRGTGAGNAIANVTVTATGGVRIAGSGAGNAIANVTSSATGRVEIRGTGATNNIENVTVAGTGRVEIKGVGANNTVGNVTSSALGGVLIRGSGANNNIGDVTATATGVIGSSVSGSLDKSIGDVTVSAVGNVLIRGSASNNIGDVTVSSTGTVLIRGTGAGNTIANVTAAGTGRVDIRGTGTTNTIGDVTSTATGTVQNRGVGSNSIGNVTVVATGGVRVAGTLSATIDPIVVTATASVQNRGALDSTIGPVTASATGVIGTFLTGTLNQNIGIFTVTATAEIQNTIRSLGASVQSGSLGGGLQKKAYSKSKFRQENMKWPTKG